MAPNCGAGLRQGLAEALEMFPVEGNQERLYKSWAVDPSVICRCRGSHSTYGLHPPTGFCRHSWGQGLKIPNGLEVVIVSPNTM
jgi:hypothetical protein